MMSLTLGNCCVHELMHASCDHYPGWFDTITTVQLEKKLKEDNLSTKDKTVTAEVIIIVSNVSFTRRFHSVIQPLKVNVHVDVLICVYV